MKGILVERGLSCERVKYVLSKRNGQKRCSVQPPMVSASVMQRSEAQNRFPLRKVKFPLSLITPWATQPVQHFKLVRTPQSPVREFSDMEEALRVFEMAFSALEDIRQAIRYIWLNHEQPSLKLLQIWNRPSVEKEIKKKIAEFLVDNHVNDLSLTPAQRKALLYYLYSIGFWEILKSVDGNILPATTRKACDQLTRLGVVVRTQAQSLSKDEYSLAIKSEGQRLYREHLRIED